MARTIGVDLGTANTYIYRKNRGIVVREPSVIAIDEEKSRVAELLRGYEIKQQHRGQEIKKKGNA